MKIKYFYSAVMTAVLALGFTACSSDDDTPAPIPEPKAETALVLDADTVKVGVGEKAALNIKSGGGEYRAFCENPEVATPTVEGNVITVSAAASGITGIVVSDAAGNYKRVIVKSMYNKIIVDKEELTLGIKLGHTNGYAKVTVLGGNGGYTAESDKEEIADIHSVSDNVINVRGRKNGVAMITVTDRMGVSKTVKVTVEATEIPYTEEEKAEIMASEQPYISFDDSESQQYGNMAVGEKDGKQVAEWNYSGYAYLRCTFTGDLSVGKKADGKVEAKTSYWGAATTYDNVTVEIIKSTDTHAWGIMYVVKDGYLFYGYFSLPKADVDDEGDTGDDGSDE